MPEDKNPLRVMIFVDFWNFQLACKGLESDYRADWYAMPRVIVNKVGVLLAPPNGVFYQACNVYGSYDASSDKDKAMLKWVHTVIGTFPGYQVEFNERQKKKRGPVCPGCHEEVRTCPACRSTMLGTGEKGVDTRIATDLIRYAWEAAYDVAVLLSSDRDFVPVVEFLKLKGKTVIHGAFPPLGAALSEVCWGKIDLPSIREEFRLVRAGR
ncbi:MAG: NYN domain-containing protein [Humidesulfovibrio sp.]